MPVSVSPLPTLGWTIADWQRAYREHAADPRALLSPLIETSAGDNAWITPLDETHLTRQLDDLAARRKAAGSLAALPLYGVPFAIKDNIDAEGWPTTAGCPAFAYAPQADATAVARLIAAGAILVGKTNLDQFATGLVGTRSPHGAVANSFDPRYISGGSSSGSASVVARGLVPFSFGTDTAGSGRVPAGFNNIVGLKPTKGWLSTQGVVPACRTQDVVSIFSLTVDDASFVAAIAGGYDGADPYSRRAPASGPGAWPQQPVLAVPDTLAFFGDDVARAAFEQALEQLRLMGVTLRRIDFAPFRELAELLYQGPWVAERFAAVESLWRRDPDSINPVVRSIVEQAARYDATATFNAEYKRAALTRRIQDALAEVDGMVVPTSPSIYTIAELDADPITLNSRLGVYTNFANLADLSALALPAGMRTDGLPAGITLIGPAWGDQALAAFGKQWLAKRQLPLGATQRPFAHAQAPATHVHEGAPGLTAPEPAMSGAPRPASPEGAAPTAAVIRVAVVGAHLRGMPLNHQLTSRDGVFVEATTTAETYRLYALANTTPPKPGLVRAAQGAAIAVELWDVPAARFGEFVAEIPAPLGIGTLTLADGRSVKGFICEPCALDDAREITSFGGWRAYIASLQTAVQ